MKSNSVHSLSLIACLRLVIIFMSFMKTRTNTFGYFDLNPKFLLKCLVKNNKTFLSNLGSFLYFFSKDFCFDRMY